MERRERNERKKERSDAWHCAFIVYFIIRVYYRLEKEEKERKGGRRMPRLWEAKKDVISCEKPRGGANNL